MVALSSRGDLLGKEEDEFKGDWGLGIGPNPQSPIPNPQSPIPNPHSPNKSP